MSEADGARWSGAGQLWAGLVALRQRVTGLTRSVRSRGNRRSVLLYSSLPALSGVNALVGLVLPALLGPTDFGQYSIAVTLFQYGLIFDFGVSQLIDRRAPGLAATEPATLAGFVTEALWVRLYIAGMVMFCGAALLLGLAAGGILPFGLVAGILSLAAGLSFMVSLGPMSIYRATSRRREFALASIACALMLAIARLVGVVMAGITGCFALLLACYAALAGILQMKMPIAVADRPGPRRASRLLLQGLPLFATSFVWAFYMTANRWVVSFLAPPLELGHFAFASNIVYLIVGTIAAMSQFYYPAIVRRAATGASFGVSRMVARDLCGLAILIALPSAIGILAGPSLIELAYRTFIGSAASVRIILVAAPGLVVSSWLMPLSLSTAARPWIEGALIYPIALALLIVATGGGYRLGGIEGAAWGLSVGAPVLLALQLGNLRYARLLTWRDAGCIFVVAAAATALLAGLALGTATRAAAVF